MPWINQEPLVRLFREWEGRVRRQERSYWLACGLWAVLMLLVLSGCAGPSDRSVRLIEACIEAGGTPRTSEVYGEFRECIGAVPRFRPDHFEQPAQPAEELP